MAGPIEKKEGIDHQPTFATPERFNPQELRKMEGDSRRQWGQLFSPRVARRIARNIVSQLREEPETVAPEDGVPITRFPDLKRKPG